MAWRSRSNLSLEDVLSGIFDDDFGLSEGQSSDEEGEGIYAYAGKPRVDPGEVAALSRAVTCEPTTIDSCTSGHSAASAGLVSPSLDGEDDQEEPFGK